MSDEKDKPRTDVGPWFKARIKIGFGTDRASVPAGEYFQMDDEAVTDRLLKEGAISKATEGDAKKAHDAKGKTTGAERVNQEILDGKTADARGTHKPASAQNPPANPPTDRK